MTRTIACLSLILFSQLVTDVSADGKWQWSISSEIQPKVTNFLDVSPIARDLKFYADSDLPLYADKSRHQPLMLAHELIACLAITNPDSKLVVDSGGGYDITVKKAQFATGKYDATFRFQLRTDIELLDKTEYLTLEFFHVEDLILKKKSEQVKALKLLIQGCLSTD